MFWKQRSVRGGADYWRRRRRKVIENLKAHGFIAQVGPAGQVVHQRFFNDEAGVHYNHPLCHFSHHP